MKRYVRTATSSIKQVFPVHSDNPTEIMFMYSGERCHATVVSELSVDPTWRRYIGRFNVGTSRTPKEYDIYRIDVSNPHLDIWGFEAVPADSESEQNKENRLYKEHQENFNNNKFPDILSGSNRG